MSLLNIRDLSYWSNSSLSSVNSAYFTFCFSSVSTDILKPGWNNLSSTNLFLCSPVSPEVGKSSASECEYDRRDCDQLQMVEDKLQYTACHVNNPLQYSLPRQQPVRAFRLSPASKLHTRRAAFPKKAEIISCGKHSLPVCTLLGVQHQRWWHQQTENTDRQGRLCDCLLKFEAVVQRRWLNKLLSNTDHPEHPLHHFLDWQLSTFSNRQMQDTGNLSDLMQ